MLAPSTHQQNAVIDCRSPRTRGQRANQSSQIDSLAARSSRWSSDAPCRTVRSAPTSKRTAGGTAVELDPRCRAIGRRPLDRDPAGRPAQPTVSAAGPAKTERRGAAAELDHVRQHPRDRQRLARCIPHDERVDHPALAERALVLRGVHAHAVSLAEDEQARARQRERRSHQVEMLAGERGEGSGIRRLQTALRAYSIEGGCRTGAHRPPRPDAAMLFRIRRWPITKAISIGIVATPRPPSRARS